MKEIELPFDFNTFDSDLEEYRISIPKGFEAEINGNEVMLKKRNEDEKIRKWLLNFIQGIPDEGLDFHFYNLNKEQVLAWLEKRGNKSQGKTALEAIQEENNDNSNKVERKFKLGDWIVDKSGLVQQVLDFRGGRYTCTYSSFTTDCESNYRLWTIQDAKDGDILAEDSCIFIIQNLVNNSTAAKTYCTLYDDGDFDDGTILYFDIDSTKPATKRATHLLFQKIKEKGYEWNADKKKLKKITL